MKQIIVLGAGYAGMMAAFRLMHRAKGAQITLVNAAPVFVERIRLHQVATGQSIKTVSIEKMLRGTGIKFVQGRVTQINPEIREVIVDGVSLHYDKLVYALGSTIDRDSVPGVRDYALALGSPEMATAIRDRLPSVKRVVVVGGGLTGIELASELADLHHQLEITVVTNGMFGAQFSAEGQAHVHKVFQKLGIILREKSSVQLVTRDQVVLSDGQTVPFDLCLWAGAFRVSPLAKEAGLAVNGQGQALVDPYLRSISHPDIYVAGDAASPVEKPGAALRMACATAMPMGIHAAESLSAELAGKMLKPFSFAYLLRCVSLGRHNGLIQFVTADDAPKSRVLTGRLGAFVKEMVCLFAFNSIRVEKHVPFYFAPKYPEKNDSRIMREKTV